MEGILCTINIHGFPEHQQVLLVCTSQGIKELSAGRYFLENSPAQQSLERSWITWARGNASPSCPAKVTLGSSRTAQISEIKKLSLGDSLFQ